MKNTKVNDDYISATQDTYGAAATFGQMPTGLEGKFWDEMADEQHTNMEQMFIDWGPPSTISNELYQPAGEVAFDLLYGLYLPYLP